MEWFSFIPETILIIGIIVYAIISMLFDHQKEMTELELEIETKKYERELAEEKNRTLQFELRKEK